MSNQVSLTMPLMVLPVIEARDFQIAFRRRRGAFAPHAVLPRWYPGFPSCIVIAFVEPDDIVHTAVEVGRLGRRIVAIQVVGEVHHEQRPPGRCPSVRAFVSERVAQRQPEAVTPELRPRPGEIERQRLPAPVVPDNPALAAAGVDRTEVGVAPG